MPDGGESKYSSVVNLIEIAGNYAVCRLKPADPLPDWADASGEFLNVTLTRDELSIVCLEAPVPREVKAERGWRCLKVKGPLDFAVTGILSSLTKPLADSGISLFAVSSFDTDYILVKQTQLEEAKAALKGAGHSVSGPG